MAAWPWILIAVAAFILILVGLLIFKKGRPHERLSPLASVAFVCIILSTVFEGRIPAYSLIGLGITLAIVDIVLHRRAPPA